MRKQKGKEEGTGKGKGKGQRKIQRKRRERHMRNTLENTRSITKHESDAPKQQALVGPQSPGEEGLSVTKQSTCDNHPVLITHIHYTTPLSGALS